MTENNKCSFEGNSDMYGMGIRIGYYLQWYAGILGAWIARDESKDLRIANSLFVTATFLALVILTIREHKPEDMPIVETYIVLFLTFGSYLVLVPIYIWRMITACNPLWDPTRFPRVNIGRVYKVCNTVILVTVLIFQLWFWVHQVPKLDDEDCPQYGFFFWKFPLNSKAFKALNIIPSIFLLGVCLTTIGLVGWRILTKGKNWRQRNNYVPIENVPQSRIYTLQVLESVFQCAVTTTIVIGVELTILWNQIEGVHEIASAGQTIPLFLGIGSVATVLYVRFFKREAEAVLSDGPPAPIRPTLVQPSQPWELGHVNTGYKPPLTSSPSNQATYPHPVQATAWDDLPGAVRGRPY